MCSECAASIPFLCESGRFFLRAFAFLKEKLRIPPLPLWCRRFGAHLWNQATVWKLRNDKVNSFLLFGNRTKINEKSPLFGGPYRNSDRQFFYSPIRRAWAISTGFFLDFCAKVKEETGAYSPGPPYGRIKKLPVRRPPNNEYEIWNIFK